MKFIVMTIPSFLLIFLFLFLFYNLEYTIKVISRTDDVLLIRIPIAVVRIISYIWLFISLLHITKKYILNKYLKILFIVSLIFGINYK
jgi:hypothetical protein